MRKLSLGESYRTSDNDTTEINLITYEKPDWKTIDIDFLSSYYKQDGNNAAVTGGLGTEYLTDFTQKIILKIPTSPKLSLNLDAGYDYYSSASTDNIDNIRASDSSSDTRIHGNAGISYKISDTKDIGFRIGGSTEYDYTSFTAGANFSVSSQNRNTMLSMSAQAFIDKWVLYFPVELRRTAQVPTDNRRSYNGSIGLAQVINKRMQVSLQLEATYMEGLLSTPFHRVYFAEQDMVRIENLPNSRLKIPIGLRLNNYLSEWLVARTYYRYYWDDWGIKGHTAGIELPIKINRFFSVYPHYRYHTQSAADYFAPHKEHSINGDFYTSDFDLAALKSHTYGMGLSYSPVDGLARIKLAFKKRPIFMVKSIDLKYSHFDRNTSFNADIISLGVSFSL